jgi:acetyl-CoA decarbonylase/synthase complex subunit gamma
MPRKAISPIKVYKLLPPTNCKRCEAENCMAFAVELVNMETRLEKCLPLLEEEKYKKNYSDLKTLLAPPVREVEFGSGERRVKLGGELVMSRHELTYLNPTVIALDVTDEMGKNTVMKRIKFIEDFVYSFIGKELRLDALAVRSISNEPEKFGEFVKFVCDKTNLPLILCSLNPEVMEAALAVAGERAPLLYAATGENWERMAELSLKHKCPLVVFHPKDLSALRALTQSVLGRGVSDLVIDPGTFVDEDLSLTINAFTMLRWKACNEEDKLSGFPLMGTPIAAWATSEGEEQSKAWREAIVAAMLIERYADILIMHSLEGWSLLPTVMLRFNIYTDPRKPVSVEPGLRTIGNPDESSPVFLTSNFALTYHLVSGDIEAGKIDCYLLVADSGGISLESSVAGRKLTAKEVADVVKESGIEKLVKHRTLIIPGKAARLMGEIEDETGWKVMVGPQDSSDIPKFIEKLWKGEKISA